MADNCQNSELLVIPCSGIGKVHGLLSREAAYRAIESMPPDAADTICLALLVTGDSQTTQMVRHTRCVTVDGCPKLCALKNVELAGGNIAKGIRVYDTMKRHRGADFGTATTLNAEGWTVVEETAAEIRKAGETPATQ
jgi:uncharacterized metal-binding protein